MNGIVTHFICLSYSVIVDNRWMVDDLTLTCEKRAVCETKLPNTIMNEVRRDDVLGTLWIC